MHMRSIQYSPAPQLNVSFTNETEVTQLRVSRNTTSTSGALVRKATPTRPPKEPPTPPALQAPTTAAAAVAPAPAPAEPSQITGLGKALHDASSAVTPSVADAALPKQLLNATPPDVYSCHDAGEAYAAAYLTRKEPFLKHTYGVNPRQHMETGGTVFRRQLVAYKTVDMFDFGVEHLSWLERRLSMQTLSKSAKNVAMAELVAVLKEREARLRASPSRHDPRVSNDVMVIMPFFSGGSGDAGHSVPELRQLYLNVTFWSFHRHIKDISVCVCTENDAEWLRGNGLPWVEIILENCHINVTDKDTGKIYDKFKPSLLGVLTSRAAQRRMSTGKWKHPYLFYTESDQVLFLRSLAGLLSLASSNRYVAPHRMLPMPTMQTFQLLPRAFGLVDRHATLELKRNERNVISAADEYQLSCCFDRGECRTRSHWKPWLKQTNEFNLVKVEDSFPMVSGEGNFLRMEFRTCEAHSTLVSCP